MTDLTEQEVCIGSLGQQKVYLHWSDVKDICTYAVSAAYEQAKEENAQLKELLKECSYRIDWRTKTGHKPSDDETQKLFDEISEVLK